MLLVVLFANFFHLFAAAAFSEYASRRACAYRAFNEINFMRKKQLLASTERRGK
jgi:hypothetical protein